jgi:hypothetical protein
VLSYHIRTATPEDVAFLADVVFEATRAQNRLPDDFDERQWRKSFSEWTVAQIPASCTSVSVLSRWARPWRNSSSDGICGPAGWSYADAAHPRGRRPRAQARCPGPLVDDVLVRDR